MTMVLVEQNGRLALELIGGDKPYAEVRDDERA